jgi:non-heme chloroperoxidase
LSYLTTDSRVRLRVTDRGEGPAIVLLHGWKSSHRLWDSTIAGLADRFRVVAFDLRGMGESDKPRAAYDFDEFAADLGFVLRKLDLEDVTLVGWSMGCSVSLQYLRTDGARVARLMLINGPLRLTSTPDFPYTMTEAELEGYIQDVAESWPTKERAFQHDSVRSDDPTFGDWMYSIALQTPLDVVLASVRHQAKLDFRDFLRDLHIPVLAVYGRHDPYYPVELATYIAQRAPRGDYLIFEDSAHCVHLEEGPRFRATLAQFATSDQPGARVDHLNGSNDKEPRS